jgi:hypothetical protein
MAEVFSVLRNTSHSVKALAATHLSNPARPAAGVQCLDP